MEVNLPAGMYVVAVSGGVDSVVLLDILSKQKDLRLIVAHFDHGIRSDSIEDRKFVGTIAARYGLPFVYAEGNLGAGASELQAREARYAFLHQIRSERKASAVITAHHQDDVLETIILNLLRGTGHRGLYSLKSTDITKRPLLQAPKKELLRYARREGLQWREDSTNVDPSYLRNYIRLNILPRFAESDREALLQISAQAAASGGELEREVERFLLPLSEDQIDRGTFTLLPHATARELLAVWFRQRGNIEVSRQLLERLVVASKTGKIGSKVDINKQYWLAIGQNNLALIPRER